MSRRKPLVKAVGEGRREGLIALRDVLATSIEEAEPQHRAALARQLVDVLGALDVMPGEEVSVSDDLVARRAARRAAAASAASAT